MDIIEIPTIQKPLKDETNSESLFLPHLINYCIVLGFYKNQLKVLLIRWKGTQEWSLPGGPIFKQEPIEAAAYRILKERTGLSQIFLQQFHVFGGMKRYNRKEIQEKLKHIFDPNKWFEREVTVGYYALVDYSQVTPTPDALTDECKWWDINAIPKLLFDHNHLIEVALAALRHQLSWQPIGHNLLPNEFTLPELQRLYETILGRTLDPRNFQRKWLSLGILDRLEVKKKDVPYKAPYLYRFNQEKYEKVSKEGNLLFV